MLMDILIDNVSIAGVTTTAGLLDINEVRPILLK